MVVTSAIALASQVSDEDAKNGVLYPPLSNIRDISVAIAKAVIEKAYEQGVAHLERPEDIEAMIRANMYYPHYR